MTDKILLVDDDPQVLDGLRVLLHGRFNISTALGPEVAIRMLRTDGPFAVVVCDFIMPGMNGVDVLSRAREIAPCTVRVMLTGFADLDTAIAAVNSGEVFRFLTKPCPAASLRQTLLDALEKYRCNRAGLQRNAGLEPGVQGDGCEAAGPEQQRRLCCLLTSKELRVADLICMDFSSKEIAAIMCISVRTVETHRDNIRRKLGLGNAKVNLQGYLKSVTTP